MKKAKTKNSKNEVRSAYDKGELKAPCVMLRCVGYNESLLQALMKAQSVLTSPPTTIRKSNLRRNESNQATKDSSRKRARVIE